MHSHTGDRGRALAVYCVSRVSSLVHANECNVASYAAAVQQAAPRNSVTVGGKINKNLDNVLYG